MPLGQKHPTNRKTKTTDFGLVICGPAGLSGSSPRLIMNSLGKKDGRIFGTDMRLELHNQLGRFASMKRALLIFSAFGYLMFLITGLDTGLGVYRSPAYCFAAVACAIVAAACVSKRLRMYWSIAGVVAIGCCLYGFYQNQEWRDRLDRIQSQQPPSAQMETNR